MEHTLTLLSAFAIGFLGSLHCVAMCGGISSALTSATPNSPDNGAVTLLQNKLFYPLLYSSGRISSYMVAGAIAGASGLVISGTGSEGASMLRIFAGIMTILLGLYISGWWNLLTHIEKAGRHLWRQLSPITRQLVPVDNPFKAMALGALWGWLPCGLVYSALTWSLGSGDPAAGALLMGCFGLGTLPAILGTGLFGSTLFTFARARSSRMVAGILLMGFGLWTITGALYHAGGSHGADSHPMSQVQQQHPQLNHPHH